MIKKDSPIPIYYQLAELIQGQIDRGELQPGDSIPSEREYAETYQLSRMTVRQAITQLVNNGYLRRVKGVGTFVAEKKIEYTMHGINSFTEDMKARGMKPGSQILQFELIPAPARIAPHLAVKENEPIYAIKRIRSADDVPMALETAYISANLIKGLTEEIINQSLYKYIEEDLNLRIDYADQSIESSVANEMESKYLNIETGSPVLLIQRIAYLQNGTPVEFVRSSYRADRYKFMIHIKR